MKVGDLVRTANWNEQCCGIVVRLIEQRHIDLQIVGQRDRHNKVVDWKSAPMVSFAEVAFGDRTMKCKQRDLEVISESG